MRSRAGDDKSPIPARLFREARTRAAAASRPSRSPEQFSLFTFRPLASEAPGFPSTVNACEFITAAACVGRGKHRVRHFLSGRLLMKRRVFQIGAIAPAIISPAIAGSFDRPALQSVVVDQRATPLRVAPLDPAGGVAAAPLIPYGGGPVPRAMPFAAYDIFEGYLDTNGDGIPDTLGPSGSPWDNLPGCTGTVPIGLRWFFGAAYNNSFASNDMSVPNPAAWGCCAEWVDFSFFWNGNGLGGPLELAIVIFTTENWAGCAAPVPDDGVGSEYPGVLYDFGLLGPGSFFTN